MTRDKLLIIAFIFAFASCKKYLETKSNEAHTIPSTLKDLRALLDAPYFSKKGIGHTITSADEYYLTYTRWNSLSYQEWKDAYVWEPALNPLSDWISQYELVYNANTVLDHLNKLSEQKESDEYREIKGAALFHRAHCFFQVAQLFAPQFDPNAADTDLGIVLRLDADFNKPSQRSTVRQTYDRIIHDLEQAVDLLPVTTTYRTRPNKPAAFALLARTFLQMGDYSKAKEAADNALNLYSTLIDFNNKSEVDTLLSDPYKNLNKDHKEVIFFLNDEASIAISQSTNVDSNLYKLYAANDIRKAAFFTPNSSNSYWFRGSYSGSNSLGNFVGLSTSEVYLIRAECNARLGSKDAALQDLNALLAKRYKTGTFTPTTTSTPSQALDTILIERRKEMAFRGMRWADLKRLNKEPSRAITIKRDLNGQVFTLTANDPRYALLIPLQVMNLSNIPQNAR